MAKWECPEDWNQWTEWLAAGLHGRCRWRLGVLLPGILFAAGRRTVTSWLRAAGVTDDFQDFYYFLQPLGRKVLDQAVLLLLLLLRELPLPDRILIAVDDTPTKRYGPQVQGAGIHHNPTPGPSDQKFVYGHIWVTLALVLRHSLWNTIGLPLVGLLYVRRKDVAKVPHRWTFRTKLELAVKGVLRFWPLLKQAGKTLWVVADGAYAKRPFLRPLRAAGVTVVSRLRKDAALYDLPVPAPRRGRGRPRQYGKNRLSLAKRAAQPRGWQTVECQVYGHPVTKTVKTFLATYPPAGGVIRVVLVKEEHGSQFFFCTDPDASVREIVEAFGDRAAIEQDFHDVKEIWGAGQQQVRNVWTNVGVFNLNLWLHTLVELWSWSRGAAELVDRRASPWDDVSRRPSHADRRRALRRACLTNEYSRLTAASPLAPKIRNLIKRLLQLST